MERLTEKHWRNLDPWECCGQDNYCQRGCHDQGGCANGCVVPKIYCRLALYEEAVEKGHIVLCPCKVGDMAYYIRGTTIYGDTVERIVIDGLDNQIILNANRAYLFSDVGSNLFFSYAEAEAALKKRKGEYEI